MIKQLILLIAFYIFDKSDVKTFLIWFINKGLAYLQYFFNCNLLLF